MQSSIRLPDDHLIADPEAKAWVEQTRRAAADGSLLARADGPDEIRRIIEKERQRLKG
jgi:hypothetical protein